MSDDALALRFSETHGENLRYTAAWGRWNMWDGCVWQQDETRHVFDIARAVCRSASRNEDANVVRRVASAATIAAVERLARSDRRHAATVDQWDSDPWILNTPEGVVDLKTGILRTGQPQDYCTKTTRVAPGGTCPQWLAFLAKTTNGNAELQGFLQRMCGYALTGVTREHSLFFLYGTGANGKSVFINTFSGLMGDYAKTAPIEAFVASSTDRHPTDLAGLQGARLVTAVETEDGRRWAESKIKALTGGDRIAARFMRQDFFEFQPQFKLLIAGNHKPAIRTVDEATRRRFHLLPFSVTVPPQERDLELTENLRNEWRGILRWAIEGCLAWQRDGLNPPMIVSNATADYLAEEDVLSHWIEECCDEAPENFASVCVLFESWKAWCDRNGDDSGSPKRFSQGLESKGFVRKRCSAARGFSGVGLKSITDPPTGV